MNRSNTNHIKPISLRAPLTATFMAILALMLWVTPALAAFPPTSGIVYEGKSVPGVALGYTRAQVVNVYGQPVACTSFGTNSLYNCTFLVGLGTVTITFVHNNPSPILVNSDTVNFIRWSQEISGWRTTKGITTSIALSNPNAVVAAYPRAIVTYNSQGVIIQVRDASMGIQVNWTSSSPTDTHPMRVSMAIFPPIRITAVNQ